MSEPLVLLPGMMCDGRMFEPQVAAFSGLHPILLAPLTGHRSVIGLADSILASAPPKFSLAGLSMGGIVAMEVIRQAPQRVTRLALMDTNPSAELPEVSAAREPQIKAVKEGDLHSVMRDEMKPRYLADTSRRAAILDLCMEMALGLGAGVFVDQSRALQSRPDQRAHLGEIRVPTLILCGALDTVCPPERHVDMSRCIVGSKLAIIEGAGHLPNLENPHRTNEALGKWLMS